MVLDELDVLKNRDSVAVHARRANSFIDNCLTSKDQFLTGESRLENEKLIPINSPDDEILNCCLKIKKLTQKVILLSNDKNLRNKANLNHVTGLSYEMLKESRDKLIQLD
jgi:predicted ribonuclease YlaK